MQLRKGISRIFRVDGHQRPPQRAWSGCAEGYPQTPGGCEVRERVGFVLGSLHVGTVQAFRSLKGECRINFRSHSILWNIYIYMYIYDICIYDICHNGTTAQGGGGSFKNRKPIGEVGCCESRMVEQKLWWIDRCFRSPLFLSLSCPFSDYLFTHRPIYLCIKIFFNLIYPITQSNLI